MSAAEELALGAERAEGAAGVQRALFAAAADHGPPHPKPKAAAKPRRRPPKPPKLEQGQRIEIWINLRSATLQRVVMNALGEADEIAPHQARQEGGQLELCRLSGLGAKHKGRVEPRRIAIAPSGSGGIYEAVRKGAWGYVEYNEKSRAIDPKWLCDTVRKVARMEYAVFRGIGTPQAAAAMFAPQATECVLSDVEVQALELAAQGRSNQQIGEKQFNTPQTIKNRFSAIYRKMGISKDDEEVNRRTEAIRQALNNNWLGFNVFMEDPAQ